MAAVGFQNCFQICLGIFQICLVFGGYIVGGHIFYLGGVIGDQRILGSLNGIQQSFCLGPGIGEGFPLCLGQMVLLQQAVNGIDGLLKFGLVSGGDGFRIHSGDGIGSFLALLRSLLDGIDHILDLSQQVLQRFPLILGQVRGIQQRLDVLGQVFQRSIVGGLDRVGIEGICQIGSFLLCLGSVLDGLDQLLGLILHLLQSFPLCLSDGIAVDKGLGVFDDLLQSCFVGGLDGFLVHGFHGLVLLVQQFLGAVDPGQQVGDLGFLAFQSVALFVGDVIGC